MIHAWTTADVRQLQQLHAAKRLRIKTMVGLSAFVERNGDPDGLVTDLLALALFATVTRETALAFPELAAPQLVRTVEARIAAATAGDVAAMFRELRSET